MMQSQDYTRRWQLSTWLCGIALVILMFCVWLSVVPDSLGILEILVYPFRLFATFIHETGHCLASLGHCTKVVVFPDGSGITEITGGPWLLIPQVGYMSVPLFAGFLLYLANKEKNLTLVMMVTGTYFVGSAFASTDTWQYAVLIIVLITIAIIILVFANPHRKQAKRLWRIALLTALGLSIIAVIALILSLRDGGTVLIVGLVGGIALILLGIAPYKVKFFVLNLLAFGIGFCAIEDIYILFTHQDAFLRGLIANDAAVMAQMTTISAQSWISVWLFLAVAILGMALFRSWQRPARVQ